MVVLLIDRHAIRYHILVNPTGRLMKWRAVDWCVELNNLFTKARKIYLPQCLTDTFSKVKNGRKGSNRLIEQIILKSPLVQVYRNVQGIIEKNFELTHHTTNHTPPNMKKTFAKLLKHLSLNSPHIVSIGRKSHHQIDNLHNKWGDVVQKMAWGEWEATENDSSESNRAELGDITVELA